ncbi:esterase/lipase family protein [Methylobacterium sp. J-090]|uniref:esterase/lipase family protein n=1 Tax=Methylobacterium sp. J-090 TaxID=2836666 RepID=UPI001FBB8F7A|nr:alpha/beta fold hydrolase [Methylobacterium sp. J-090]MCJ2079975.1 alpha/beta fold hydrolase [Methylobacterium sp. J-090]
MRHPDPGPIPGAGPPEGVLFLHGIARRASSLARMERAFRAQGHATLNLDYPARTAALADLAAGIAPPVAAFAARVRRLHVVTHSMGGLVARALLTRHRPDNLGRVVMLAPPNGGSEVADRLHRLAAYRSFFGPAGAQLTTRRDAELAALLGPVDYPLGVIAGDRTLYPVESWLMLPRPNDGRVSVDRTRVAGMSAHVTLHTTHGLMMWNPRVIGEALHFVRNGRFLAPDAKPSEGRP